MPPVETLSGTGSPSDSLRTPDSIEPGRWPASLTTALFIALAHATADPDHDHDLPLLLQVVAESLDFDVATLWWWKPDEEVLRCEHVWHSEAADCGAFLDVAMQAELRRGEPLPGLVFAEGVPTWVPDIDAIPNFRRAAAARTVGLHSGVAIPIRARGEVVGVFELFTFSRRGQDAPLLEVVAAAAAHLGDFIERARLLRDLEAARRRQDFLLEANRALSTTRGLAETIDRLARVAVPAIGDLCLVDVVAKSGAIERLTAYHGDPAQRRLARELRNYPPDAEGNHPAAIVIRTGVALVSHEMPREFLTSTTQGAHHFAVTRQLDFSSYVSAPLRSATGPIGALTVVSAGSGRHFGEDELHLVEELAGQVASVVEREQRFDEQHHVSHILQRSMLPEVESPEGLEVCARYLGGSDDTEVGGDFYDVIALGATKVALVIGDVQGHDLVAATVMAQVRSALRAFLQVSSEAGEALGALDRYVADQREDRFVTVTLMVLDVTTGALEVAVAGHPVPLITGPTIAAIKCAPGVPLGVGRRFGPSRYETTHAAVPMGSGLFCYTDGLVETHTGGPDARLPALVDAVTRHRDGPIFKACDAVIAETLDGDSPDDDVAVMWVVRHPRSG